MRSLDQGRAGSSALAEHERRVQRDRERRGARALPLMLTIALVAAVVAAVGVVAELLWGAPWLGAVFAGAFAVRKFAPSQRTEAWRVGAQGEQRVSAMLEELDVPGTVLHDRRVPRTHANIDHIVVLSSGVTVVDAKRYRGRLEIRGRDLLIAGRRRSDLLDKLARQVDLVQGVVGLDVPVTGALAFVDTHLSRHELRLGSALVCTRQGLRRHLRKHHTGDVDIDRVSALLDINLPRAFT